MIKLSRWQLHAEISIKKPFIDGNFVSVGEFVANASSIPSSYVFSKASSIPSSVKSAEFNSASLIAPQAHWRNEWEH